MKSSGILNADLAGHIARLGHTQRLIIADYGLPIPSSVPRVDLALVRGSLAFEQVLDAILDEVVVETATLAIEAKGTGVETWFQTRGFQPRWKPHDELKDDVASASFVVRTGEATPYANAILTMGVPF